MTEDRPPELGDVPAGWRTPSPRYERLCALVRELADAADASVSEIWDAYDRGELMLCGETTPLTPEQSRQREMS